MVQQSVQKIGGTFVLVIPDEEVERLGLVDGQVVEFDIRAAAGGSELRPELRAALLATWEEDREAYVYLAGR